MWEKCLHSEFLTHLADGTLDEACFKGYIVEDSLYTENYAKDAAEGVVTFTPAASGDYTFTITAARKDEADKTGTDKEFKGFELPLAKPSFQSATSQGGGKVSLV
mgnify:CR=1 FL=1